MDQDTMEDLVHMITTVATLEIHPNEISKVPHNWSLWTNLLEIILSSRFNGYYSPKTIFPKLSSDGSFYFW